MKCTKDKATKLDELKHEKRVSTRLPRAPRVVSDMRLSLFGVYGQRLLQAAQVQQHSTGTLGASPFAIIRMHSLLHLP
jgi:hypothetical protein